MKSKITLFYLSNTDLIQNSILIYFKHYYLCLVENRYHQLKKLNKLKYNDKKLIST